MEKFLVLAVSVCLYCVSGTYAGTLFQIGQPDGYSKEFKIFRNLDDHKYDYMFGYPVRRREFRDVDKVQEFFDNIGNFTFTVGKSKDKDWPFIHPIRDCYWVNLKNPPTYKIAFDIGDEKSKPDNIYYLRIGLNDASRGRASTFNIYLNGKKINYTYNMLGYEWGETKMGCSLAYHPESWGITKTATIKIPFKEFKPKGQQNVIEIQSHDAYPVDKVPLWFTYDYISLSDNIDEPKVENRALQLTDKAIKAMGTEEVVFCVRSSSRDPHWYANFGKTVYAKTGNEKIDSLFDKEVFSRMGGKLVVYNLKTGAYRYLINDKEGSVRDPRVHYSGKKILFSYRKGDDNHFRLYEINTDGSNLRKLPIDGDWDDIEPCYLPNGDIVYPSSRHRKVVQCFFVPVATLNRYFVSENKIRAISVNPDQDNTPAVMKDGRIIYMRWDYNHRSQVSYHHLWTMNPDGSGDMIFLGNNKPGGLFIAPKQIPDEDAVLFSMSGYHGATDSIGYVAKVNNSCDPSSEYSFKLISGDYDMFFYDPYPLKGGICLTSTHNKIVIMSDGGQMYSDFQLPKDLFEGEQMDRLTFGGKCYRFIRDVQPLAPRKPETIIPDKAEYDIKTATLSLIDIYNGREMATVKKGSIKKLLVTEMLPEPAHYHGGPNPISHNGGFAVERVWGVVDVEEDGSCMFEVPSSKALAFSALDENGRCVKRMQSFVGLTPGTTTSCIGCHEDRTIAPNLQKLPKSYSKGVQRLQPVGDRKMPYVFDFARDIQPLLNKYCVKCHNNDLMKGCFTLECNVGITDYHSFINLLWRGQFKNGRNEWGNFKPYDFGSGSSKIMDKATGSHKNEKFTAKDLETLRMWLDTGSFQLSTLGSINGTFLFQWYFETLLEPQVNWEETKIAEDAMNRRCGECHKDKTWQLHPFKITGIQVPNGKGAFKNSRSSSHFIYNFSEPEKSLVLRLPLAKEQGGYGDTYINHPIVFKDKNDADYKKILAVINRAANYLKENSPNHMSNFYKPNQGYIKAMQEIGLIDKNYDGKTNIPAFEMDEKYLKWIENTLEIDVENRVKKQ